MLFLHIFFLVFTKKRNIIFIFTLFKLIEILNLLQNGLGIVYIRFKSFFLYNLHFEDFLESSWNLFYKCCNYEIKPCVFIQIKAITFIFLITHRYIFYYILILLYILVEINGLPLWNSASLTLIRILCKYVFILVCLSVAKVNFSIFVCLLRSP